MGRNKENMNYLGKIVISGGRKAKVVNEIQNELEIVFQKNGKYQGNVATVRKGEVTLLDKRKNPEKYPLSEEEKKIEEALQSIQKNPSNSWAFELFKSYIEKAKSIGTDVSKYEAMLPEIRKKYYSVKFEWILTQLKENPGYIGWLLLFSKYCAEATEFWIDISKSLKEAEELLWIEEKLLPEVYKNYYLVKIEEELKTLQENPKDRDCLELCVSHFQTAIENWIDVSKYTKRFQQCLVKARESRVGMGFIRKYPEVDKIYRQAMKPIEDKFVFGS